MWRAVTRRSEGEWTYTLRGSGIRMTPRLPIALTGFSMSRARTTKGSVYDDCGSPRHQTPNGYSPTADATARYASGTNITPTGSSRERTGRWQPSRSSAIRPEMCRCYLWWIRSMTGWPRRSISTHRQPWSSEARRIASDGVPPKRVWPSGTCTNSDWLTSALTSSYLASSTSSGPTAVGTATRIRPHGRHRYRKPCCHFEVWLGTSEPVERIHLSGVPSTRLPSSCWTADFCGIAATALPSSRPGAATRCSSSGQSASTTSCRLSS